VHLRSAKEVRGYHIQETDGPMGHGDDFIIDDETWEVRYLVIDTSNWWPDKKVLVPALGQPHHWAEARSSSKCLDRRSRTAPSGARPRPSTASTKRAFMTTTDARCTGIAAINQQGRRHRTSIQRATGDSAQFSHVRRCCAPATRHWARPRPQPPRLITLVRSRSRNHGHP